MAGPRGSQEIQKISSKEALVDSSRTNSSVAAPPDLTTLTTIINSHLKNHHERSGEECQALMGSVAANLEDLMDIHFSTNAEPSRVSEMLLFHTMFSG